MNHRIYCVISGVIFLAVAVAHLSRLFLGWEIAFGGEPVPRWMSVPGLIVPGLLSAWAFKLAAAPRTA
ncbi:MAG TPA: hypothetical protein VJ826_12510 [Candidatus Polarisedimenticolaceae bacterium]|nr:hypothetical protein [Candidatus Polarisedimenticolaceae bacterium]